MPKFESSARREIRSEDEAWLRRVISATDEEAAGFLLQRPFPFLADEWCNTNLSEEDIDRLFDLLSTLRLPTKPTVSIRGLSVETIEALVDSGETFDKDELAELPAETLYRVFVRVSQPLAT